MPGINEIAKKAGLDVGLVAKVFDTILVEVKEGEQVKIKNFGTFKRRKTPGRKLSTPIINGGKDVVVPPGYCLAFHQSTSVKAEMNGKAAPAASETKASKTKEKPAPEKKAAPEKKGKPAAAKKPAKADVDEDDDEDEEEDEKKKPAAKKAPPSKKAAPKKPVDEDEDDEDEDEDESSDDDDEDEEGDEDEDDDED